MSMLRSFIEKLETSGAVVASDAQELAPPPPPLAAAEAAIEEAIRRLQASDCRDTRVSERRDPNGPAYEGQERRQSGERRGKGLSFGRRTRN